jgi:hypothetical protein
VKNIFFKCFILAGMLTGLPLLGIALTDIPLRIYLAFPPKTGYIIHAPFSWAAFIGLSIFILTVIIPFISQWVKAGALIKPEQLKSYPFPWWGWIGVVAGLIAWALAWTRFPWFTRFQQHTFVLLWLSYIVVVNALTYRRKGSCMITARPGFFLLLFPASAIFWWFFEYLNRFVQNWYYIGVSFSPWEYFRHASLSFSTVLPAVLGTSEWLSGSFRIKKRFESFIPLYFVKSRALASIVLMISGAGLFCIGLRPDYFFPLVWVSPLRIIVSLQILSGEFHVFSDTFKGDWVFVVSSAMAALLCGCFWEMWNYYSLSKWEYSVPFVHGFKIFEMPILGYAGYLPFGLECAAIGNMLENLFFKKSGPKGSYHDQLQR